MADKKALYSVTLKFTSAKQLSNFLSSQLPFDCEVMDLGVVKKSTSKPTSKRPHQRTQTKESKVKTKTSPQGSQSSI